jgi:hypothetical protein
MRRDHRLEQLTSESRRTQVTVVRHDDGVVQSLPAARGDLGSDPTLVAPKASPCEWVKTLLCSRSSTSKASSGTGYLGIARIVARGEPADDAHDDLWIARTGEIQQVGRSTFSIAT